MPYYRAIKLVTLGGAIAATLDIVYAFVFYGYKGVAPVKILQSISSGLLGMDAYSGGTVTAGLGMILHFAIAIVAAFIFFAVSKRWEFLVRHTYIAGALFGLCIYAFMNFLVLPLSAFPHSIAFPFKVLVPGLLVHVFLVGLPIAIFTTLAAKPS